MRVHILASELNVSSKAIIEKCRAEGIDSVKNHMSTLSAGLHATIKEWFSEGKHETALETTDRIDLDKVRLKPRRKIKGEAGEDADHGGESATATMEAPTALDPSETDDEAVSIGMESVAVPPAPARTAGTPIAPSEPVSTDVVVEVIETPVGFGVAAPTAPPTEIAHTATTKEETAPAPIASKVEAAPAVPAHSEEVTIAEAPRPVTPAGPQNIPVPAKLQGPRVVRYEAPDYDLPPVRRGPRRPDPASPPPAPVGPPVPGAVDAARAATDKPGVPAKKKGRVNPRRIAGRLAEAGERLSEWRDRDLEERQERLAGATGRKIHRRAVSAPMPGGKGATPAGPKTQATVHEPVRIKELCAEAGLNFIQLYKVLRDEHDLIANVNMTLPVETAQMLALHFGIELEVIPAKTKLDELRDEFMKLESRDLRPRPPVVTILGHVDHGKTSLLDAIRKSRVVADEDGGITQHIGSYHIETAHGAVTFLDTPGHEAFTAMRARGAQLTDVVVLVVAADDGLMPQTIEAINHAKTAKVPIVVALNKIDLGDQNKLKIFGQLAEHGLVPSGEWGGDTDVIPTSATIGIGIKELVEHLADLSSLLDLRADPTLPACGAVIEAETKPGVGSVVRVLIQSGTLRVGDFVVCGNAFGKVRALLDDRGRKVASVGPAIPVEVWGLDDVPTAGDQLYQVDNLQRAKEIASETAKFRLESGRQASTKSKTLEEMFHRRDVGEIPELNLIIKADVDGSVAALKHALAEIPSDEVRLSIRHAGVGSVNDSDILLAATCGGIVAAFRVDTSVGARRLAEQHGVEVRPYRVIYDVCDDIKKALEGLLAPEERIESRGSAQVRQVFHISKLGLVAGCYVSDGTIERSHLAKVIRDGVVVRDKCRFSSLRRFKDDVREVRAGMECGLRLEGFDDVHAGDVVETFEIVKIARTL